MAFTYTDFKKSLRTLFGRGQTIVSGDGGGDNKDHVDRLVSRIVRAVEFPATATVTQPFVVTPKVGFVAEEECDIVAIRVSAAGSLTVSNTDHVLLTCIKRKATTFSATESVGTVALGRTTGTPTWTNKVGFSASMTIATTNSVIDMDPGDSLTFSLSKPGAAVALQSPVSVVLTVREK